MKNKIKKYSFIILFFGLILVIGGITYAFFNFTAFSNELVTTSGQVYVKMNKSNTDIILNNVFPETYEEASIKNNNYIDFTVIGKNTYNDPVYYEIDLEYGDDVQNKERIDDKYLKFELSDITDSNNIEEIFSNVSFDYVNGKKIFVDTINDTDNNYSKTYRLRMWYDENIIISDTESNADFRASNNEYQTENSSLPLYTEQFSSIKIKVYGDFIEKVNPYADTPATCFTYTNNGNNISISRYNDSCGNEVRIPKKIDGLPVTEIKAYAFASNTIITSINLPNTLTSIGNYAFRSCANLTSITIPKSVTSIGANIVGNCSNLNSIIVDSNNPIYDSRNNCNAIIKTSTNELIQGCNNTIIPNNVTYIDDYAFYWCTGLTNIVIPNGVVSIGNQAFEGCSGLTELYIPNSVIEIGYDAFLECSGLVSINVNPNNTVFDSRNNCNAIIETSRRYLVLGCKNTIIPNDILYIGDSSFYGCTGLTSINIPNNIVSLGDYAFSNCTGLTSIVIPNSVTYIYTYVFNGCSGLTSVQLPSNLSSIPEGMFCDCSSLTSFVIPNGTEEIERYGFYGCENLTSVTIPASVTNIETDAFRRCFSLTDIYVKWNNFNDIEIDSSIFSEIEDLSSINLHVPSGTRSLYSNDEIWGQFNIIEDNN